MLFTHCQKRDFGAKNRSVLSKILIGFSENPLELGEIGGDSRTRIFTAFSTQMGVQSLENTAFSGFFHLMPTILTNIYNSVRTPILFQLGTMVFCQIPFLNFLYAGLFIVLLPFVYKSYRKYGLKK